MRMPPEPTPAKTNERTSGSSIHRKCSACEDEEDERIQRKPLSTSSAAAPRSPGHVQSALSSGGSPLDKATRNFFEPRLGYDLGSVRLHTGSAASESTRALDARAYTLGNDIVFGSGEFDADSDGGRHLIAHELAHVVQQDDNAKNEIRRMTIGTGTPPQRWITNYNARTVPADELERVNEAIAHIQQIVDNPATYPDCIAEFVEHCRGQSPTAFTDTFNNAVLWRGDSEGYYAWGSRNGRNILYTQMGYDQGARGLAQTLVHEMGHNCGVTSGDDHYFAEVSANYCVGPQNYIGARLGSGFSAATPLSVALVYRRLFDLALGGRLQFTVGGDIDLAGLLYGAFELGGLGVEDAEFEIASTWAGLRGRFPAWGGEGLGGLTLGAEAGLDVGRFRIVRETEPDEYEYGPGFVFQTTLGAEFIIPNNPHISNLAPEIGYRLIRPLNPEAENIHELILGIGGMF